MRISGVSAFAAVEALAGTLPPPRRASLRTLRHKGNILDRALVLAFPGPGTATGEDLVELHCHGGRAVIAAVEAALTTAPGLRHADAGEFTRRALENGRIDLLEAEGLADLLEAETEAQRVAALAAAEGRLSACVCGWLGRISALSAEVEAMLDHADEDDVPDDAASVMAIGNGMAALRGEIEAVLAAPSVERLRDGVRVVIAGPPNAGKSTLLNLLIQRDAAIVSPVAGTTRDRIEAPVVRAGMPLLLIDTAGLVDSADVVEAIGVSRAQEAIAAADLLLWLADTPPTRTGAIWIHARRDLPGRQTLPPGRALGISAFDPASIELLWNMILDQTSRLLRTTDSTLSMREHQRQTCRLAADALVSGSDALLLADALAHARRLLARLLGLDATETMLDVLFSRFCVGK